MLNKDNITSYIKYHQQEIDELVEARAQLTNETARKAIQEKINYLEDNKARCMMQARAWGVSV